MIHSLTEEEQENLPTNNLNCERHLAKFGRIAAESAAHSNKFFTGKRIRDDLMFDGSSIDLNVSEFNINLINMRTFRLLDQLEIQWTADQKEKRKLHIKKNQKRKNQKILKKQNEKMNGLTVCFESAKSTKAP